MNPDVERDRETALAILQPSPRQLEHGLELHRDSLVVESYGFAPRAEADEEVLSRLDEEGASDAEIEEIREQMFLGRMAEDSGLREEFCAAFEVAGVDCIFQNAGEEGQAPLRLLRRLADFTYVTDRLRPFLTRATTPEDIVQARERGSRCLYLSGNGVPLAQEWRTVEEELRFIRIFFRLGVRMMHLTYNRRNMLGDGCAEKSDAGLSAFGEAAVREMNRVGVIVDVAHSGQKTSAQAARISRYPVVASHSGVHALSGHPRCKTDETLRAIVDGGGTVGICCVPAFLGGSGDINAFLDHVDYVARKFGVDAVTIGTDRAYVPAPRAAQPSRASARRRRRPRFEALWPPHDPLHSARWREARMQQSLAWTNWPLFTVGLVQRGYSDEDIRKILGGNILRVAREVLSAVPASVLAQSSDTSPGA